MRSSLRDQTDVLILIGSIESYKVNVKKEAVKVMCSNTSCGWPCQSWSSAGILMIHFLKQNVDIKIPFHTQEVEMKYSCVHICNQDTEHFYFEIGMYGLWAPAAPAPVLWGPERSKDWSVSRHEISRYPVPTPPRGGRPGCPGPGPKINSPNILETLFGQKTGLILDTGRAVRVG